MHRWLCIGTNHHDYKLQLWVGTASCANSDSHRHEYGEGALQMATLCVCKNVQAPMKDLLKLPLVRILYEHNTLSFDNVTVEARYILHWNSGWGSGSIVYLGRHRYPTSFKKGKSFLTWLLGEPIQFPVQYWSHLAILRRDWGWEHTIQKNIPALSGRHYISHHCINTHLSMDQLLLPPQQRS